MFGTYGGQLSCCKVEDHMFRFPTLHFHKQKPKMCQLRNGLAEGISLMILPRKVMTGPARQKNIMTHMLPIMPTSLRAMKLKNRVSVLIKMRWENRLCE